MLVRAARISLVGIGRLDTTSGAADPGALAGAQREPRDTRCGASPAQCCNAPPSGDDWPAGRPRAEQVVDRLTASPAGTGKGARLRHGQHDARRRAAARRERPLHRHRHFGSDDRRRPGPRRTGGHAGKFHPRRRGDPRVRARELRHDHLALRRHVLQRLRPGLCEPAACRTGRRRAPVRRLAECRGKSVHDDGRARRGTAPAEHPRPPAGRAGAVRLRGPAPGPRILEESGWAEIDIRPIDVVCTLPEKELVRYFTRLGPVGLILHEADERTRAQVIETVRAAFDPYVHGAEVRFTAACWMVGAQAG